MDDLEIQTAYSTMLSALPFEERGLAKDIIEASRTDPETRAAWRRAPSMNLQTTVDEAFKEGQKGGFVLRRLSLFCDTLIIKAGTTISWKNDSGFRLRIFARRVVAESTPSLTMVLNERAAFAILSTEFPLDFQVSFGIDSTQSVVKFIPKDTFGMQVTVTKGQLVPSGVEPPEADLAESIDYFKQLKDDGTLDSDKWVDDNLPRLLQFQFLVASTQVDRNPSLALRLLNFVCSASNTSASRDFNIQATALRSSIVARQASNTSVVPSVNVFNSKSILKARLLAATAFEAAFQNLISQERTSDNLTLFASDAFYANRNAITEYAFLEDNAQQAYSDATKSFDIAKANYTKKQSELDAAGTAFRNGVKEWKLKQELEAAKEVVFAIVEVASAIVATVATAGAAAPVAGLAVANAASKAGKIAGMIAKIKEIVVKIKELYEKFEPLLEQIKGLVEAIQRMLDIIGHTEPGLVMPELKQADAALDPINTNVLWDAFTIDVTAMFQELETYAIGGKAEYKTVLLKMPIYAKAYITAQVAVVTTGQSLAGIRLRKKLDQEQHVRLEGTLRTIKSSSTVLNLLKRAMFDRVLAVRNLIYIDFWTYKAAFQYHSLTNESYLNVYTTAVQRISDYQTDAARLQAAVYAFGATVRIQQKNFTIAMALDAVQRQSLKDTGSISFTPAIDSNVFAGFYRIRMSRARAFLDGAPGSSSDIGSVRLHLSTSGRFVDRDFPYSQRPQAVTIAPPEASLIVREDSSGAEVPEPLLSRAFIGEPRTIAFEYKGNEQILCDGDFGLSNDYTKQTPFQEWTLQVKSSTQDPLNLTSVNSIRWEFLCEVCAV